MAPKTKITVSCARTNRDRVEPLFLSQRRDRHICCAVKTAGPVAGNAAERYAASADMLREDLATFLKFGLTHLLMDDVEAAF